jgi:hypothetical protein
VHAHGIFVQVRQTYQFSKDPDLLSALQTAFHRLEGSGRGRRDPKELTYQAGPTRLDIQVTRKTTQRNRGDAKFNGIDVARMRRRISGLGRMTTAACSKVTTHQKKELGVILLS